MSYYFTSESVSDGHLDKDTDQISVILLDNFLVEGLQVNLGCAPGHPSFVMSNSFTNETLAQLVLWNNSENYENKVYRLPKHLDEKVAAFRLTKLGAELTELKQDKAEYIGVTVKGPFKPEYYTY